ncbi:partial Intermembrane transport protein YebS, partial [Anaerolineae bacterium]
ACPECDLLLKTTALTLGDKAHCPRCGALLARPCLNSIERIFALSIAGLILIFPSMLLPMVSIKIMDNSSTGTLWSGVAVLFSEGMWITAIAVCLTSILFPIIHILLSLLISSHLYLKKYHKYLIHWMRLMQHLDEWVMLEVYMLGIIVACVKLLSISQLKLGFGLYAFIALLIITSMTTSSLDTELFWQHIQKLREKANE